MTFVASFSFLGSCMLYVQKINYLNGCNCTGFRDGCPDRMYSSDESYLCK